MFIGAMEVAGKQAGDYNTRWRHLPAAFTSSSNKTLPDTVYDAAQQGDMQQVMRYLHVNGGHT
jgi:hypothetical protein